MLFLAFLCHVRQVLPAFRTERNGAIRKGGTAVRAVFHMQFLLWAVFGIQAVSQGPLGDDRIIAQRHLRVIGLDIAIYLAIL